MNQPEDGCGKNFEIIIEDDWIRIRVRPDTVVTNDLIISILKELYSLEAYRSEKVAGLWDFRGCGTDLDYDKLREVRDYIVLHYNPGWSHTYTAIVADGDLNYGLARMYEIMTEDVTTTKNIFRDMDEAQKWLKENSI